VSGLKEKPFLEPPGLGQITQISSKDRVLVMFHPGHCQLYRKLLAIGTHGGGLHPCAHDGRPALFQVTLQPVPMQLSQ